MTVVTTIFGGSSANAPTSKAEADKAQKREFYGEQAIKIAASMVPIPGTRRIFIYFGKRRILIPQPTTKSAKPPSILKPTSSWKFPEGALDKMPKNWVPVRATKKVKKEKVGLRWADPKQPKANNVRIDRGEPFSEGTKDKPFQQEDHVVVVKDGKVLGPDGKPIEGTIKENPQAHIPLKTWLNWKTWYSP